MGSPNQPRDSRGRFASSGRVDPERAADQKRIEKAQREARLADLNAALNVALTESKALKAETPTRRDDPHDVVDWEKRRARNRAKVAELRARIKETRSAR